MDDLIPPELAAKELNLPVSTLAMDRRNRRLGIPFFKLGRRVRYSKQQLQNWLAQQLHSGGSQS